MPDLGRLIQFPPELVHKVVHELAGAGLVHMNGALVQLVELPGLFSAIDQLASLYDEDRLLVVTSLSEIAMNRIRGMAARTFADAFQLRKKKGQDDG